MKQLLLYVQDPHALKNWSTATEMPKKILYTLDLSDKDHDSSTTLLLIQYQNKANEQKEIESLLSKGYSVLLFSNQPSPAEGVEWFQRGIKGYLNTYSTTERIEQAIDVVKTGNIWLGQAVMQTMIQAVAASENSTKNDSWKALLTDREIETMEWIQQGKTNIQISEEMHISERTVKAHVHNMLEKLDAKDRLGLVLKVQNWTG